MRQWMMTYSGRRLDPGDPRPDVIDITDVAHHLALVNRYGGATREPYSVAEHCVHVSHHVPPYCALEALLHDAGEFVVGDIIRPVKDHNPAYDKLEKGWQAAAYQAFGIEPTNRSRRHVKHVDDRIVLDETRALMADPDKYPGVLPEGLEPLGVNIMPWSWQQAKRMFLLRFASLR